MSAAGTPYESQARLWLVAFGVSALVNLLALGVIGFWVIASIALRPPVRSVEPAETVAMIVPRLAEDAVAVSAEPSEPLVPAVPAGGVEPKRSANRPFVRTSSDQATAAPEKADFIGERNTLATSDSPPQGAAPEMPQQKGREPISGDEIETTESDYNDGDLGSRGPDGLGEAEMVAPPEPAAVVEPQPAPAPVAEPAAIPEPAVTKERLAEGPVPVDRRVKMAEAEELPKPLPPERLADPKEPAEQRVEPTEQPKPATPSQKPGFRGNQSKTRLEGSIDRTGRSALNVEDSVLGRYHATVSRAVEKAWQLNCVRNRDYITPGQLTLRVMLEPTGKVRSMGVVEEIGVGNIQKGFTLNSIREAEIPVMPAPLKKQLDGEPLELIYRFNF